MPKTRGPAREWRHLDTFPSLAEYNESFLGQETQKDFSLNKKRGKNKLVTEFNCQFGPQCKYTACPLKRKIVVEPCGTVTMMETNNKHNHVEICERREISRPQHREMLMLISERKQRRYTKKNVSKESEELTRIQNLILAENQQNLESSDDEDDDVQIMLTGRSGKIWVPIQ